MKAKTVDEFIAQLADYLPSLKNVEFDQKELQKEKLSLNECLFVWDVASGEMLFTKGFHDFLGYGDNELSLNEFVELFHPEDHEYIRRIGQAAVNYSMKNPGLNEGYCLCVSHRLKKSNGQYIKVLAKSTPYSIDKRGMITSFLVRIFDIGFLDTSDSVQYKFMAGGMRSDSIDKLVSEYQRTIFTPREMEVISQINSGRTNSQIAEYLKISKFTVATHRKKILKKSECHSARELIEYCRRNRVI